MEAKAYETSLFKDIFPTYNDFEEWYTSTPLSDNLYSDEANDVPSERTFTILFYEYSDSHVAFSDESFKNRFAVDIYTYYKEFEATTKAIDDLMSLTDNDIIVDGAMITNVADVPETTSTTNIDVVNYISQQQKAISTKGKLRISKELISAKRAYTVRSFVKKFDHLFQRVYSPYYTFVVRDDE